MKRLGQYTRTARGTYRTDGFGMSHKQIGAVLGISRQRAEQIERAALKKLRRILDFRAITLADLLPRQPGADKEDYLESP